MDPDQSGLTSEQQAVRSLIGGMNHTRKMAVINVSRVEPLLELSLICGNFLVSMD